MGLKVRQSGVFVNVGGGTTPTSEWVRPADWPALPAVAATDQVFRGLHAVYNSETNFATIRCTGAFTVDWGDGSSPVNVASNTTAQYNYSFSASGLGAVTSRGYKTAIVTVTPQAGQTLSSIDLSQKHTQTGLVNGHSSKWLDIRLAMNNAGTVTTWLNVNWVHRLLERFEWVGGSNVQTSFNSFLRDCTSLQSLPLFNTGAGTTFNNFLNNTGLRTAPLFNTGAATSMNTFISSNPYLEELPLYNTALNTNFVSFASGNPRMRSVPLWNTASGTNFGGFLNANPSLAFVPAYNMTAATSLSNFFTTCPFIARIEATFPANLNIILSSLSLGPTALNEIFTNLPVASGLRTINVSGNWGTSQGSYNQSIATAKGWTVTS